MKKITYILLIALAAITSFTACDREKMDNDLKEQGEGSVNLVSLKGLSVDVSSTTITRASEEINTDNYLIRIYNADNELVQEWKLSELPEIFTLKVGTYTIQALSHEVQPAEFEKPYYYAEESFTIVANEVIDLEPLVCRLQNIQVSVTYDEKLMALMGDDVVTTVTVGNESLPFKKGETRSGYFQSNQDGTNVLTATMAGLIDGNPESVPYPIKDVKAGQHRIIKFFLKYVNDDGYLEGGFTSLKLAIVAQCTILERGKVVDQEEEVIPDPNPSGPEGMSPTIEGDGFNLDDSLIVPIRDDNKGITVVINIAAENGISNLRVKIDSETLTPDVLKEVQLASEFDLAYPGDLEEGLKSLEFPVGESVIGATELKFDVSRFTGLLGIYGEATHKFIITVIDKYGRYEEKTLTLISKKVSE